MTHDELAGDLAAHLRGYTDRIVWEDMQLGPCGAPRPDLYSIRKSYTHPRPMAYEVKVSRSDFRKDVCAGKWQMYLKYASGVVFATEQGLLKCADIPSAAGWIVRGENGWSHRKRPTLNPVTIPQKALLKLCIDGIERQRRECQPRAADPWLRAAIARGTLSRQVADVISDMDHATYKVRQAHDHAETLRRRTDTEAAAIRAAITDLWAVLDLEPGSPPHMVQAAISRIRGQVEDATAQILRQVRDARGSLDRILQRHGS